MGGLNILAKNFFIVVQLQLSPLSPSTLPCPTHPPPSTFNPPHPHCLCPWVLYTRSLTWPFPFCSPLSPSPLPSGHCQFVLYFYTSSSILLACLFHWLGPLIGKILWYLSFTAWLVSRGITLSSSFMLS